MHLIKNYSLENVVFASLILLNGAFAIAETPVAKQVQAPVSAQTQNSTMENELIEVVIFPNEDLRISTHTSATQKTKTPRYMTAITLNAPDTRDERDAKARRDTQNTEFTLYPYYWATDVKSTMSGQGIELPVELNPDDILKATDSGLTILVKAKRGQSVMTGEVSYLDASGLNSSVLTPVGSIPVVIDSELRVIELWMGERFGEGESWIELYIGGRDVKNTSDVHLGGTSTGNKVDWHEGLLGQHTHVALTERLSVFTRGSIGNLNEDEQSYDIIVGAGYQISKRTGILVGYRAQKLVYDGEDNHGENVKLVTKTKGPAISISIKL